MTPHQELTQAIADLSERGHRPPCTSDPEAWTGDDPSTYLRAAAVCLSGCPLLEPCRTAGIAFDHGVWGGSVRSKPSRRRKTA